MLDDAKKKSLDCRVQDMFDKMENSCELVNGFQVNWTSKGTGFGQFYFYHKEEDGKTHCSNELMSKEFIKKMLCQMVDDCILDEK